MAITEKQVFQTTIGILSLVPLSAGIAGVLLGPSFLGTDVPPGTDLSSHFRYLSGLLVGVWVGYVFCIPHIERTGIPFRTLSIIVFCGGLARLYSLWLDGQPSLPHYIALGVEIGLVPLLALWQMRIARKAKRAEVVAAGVGP